MSDSAIYLEDVRESLARIQSYTAGGRDDFFAQAVIQDAVIRNFEIIGEALKRVDAAVLENEPDVDWAGFKGFRDVLIHAYMHVDLDIVWATIERDLPGLRAAVERLLATPSQRP
jgi:uncharacterized protein with HEPN domain